MGNFVGGVLVGVVLSASLGLASGLYDRQGNPTGPRGSVQQFDYFRQRQLQLDVGALRRQAEQGQGRLNMATPCEKK